MYLARGQDSFLSFKKKKKNYFMILLLFLFFRNALKTVLFLDGEGRLFVFLRNSSNSQYIWIFSSRVKRTPPNKQVLSLIAIIKLTNGITWLQFVTLKLVYSLCLIRLKFSCCQWQLKGICMYVSSCLNLSWMENAHDSHCN